jgi:glutamate dehydrogenase/leucine dehydrogenase
MMWTESSGEEWKRSCAGLSFEERQALDRLHETMRNLAASFNRFHATCNELRAAMEGLGVAGSPLPPETGT